MVNHFDIVLLLAYALLAVHACDREAMAGVTGKWTYKAGDNKNSCDGTSSTPCGPKYWGNLGGASACFGTSQSPIAISSASAVQDSSLKLPTFITTSGGCSDSAVFTDDHVFEFSFQEKSCTNLGLTFKGETFTLLQIHTHQMSEHTLDGQVYDAEMHMVHKSATGNLLVLGIFLTTHSPSPSTPVIDFFDPFWNLDGHDIIKLTADLPSKLETSHSPPANPYAQLTSQLTNNFFYYKGSLTTPPCSEGVNWLVFSTPLLVNRQSIYNLRAVVTGHPGTVISENLGDNRPVQPLNGRIIAKPATSKAPTSAPVKKPKPTSAPVKKLKPTSAPVKKPKPTSAPVKKPKTKL